MISSFVISVLFVILTKQGLYTGSSASTLIITIAATTVCWVAAAYLAPQTDRATLIEFYRKVRPAGPGWTPIREAAGLSESELAKRGDSMPLALVGWVAGSMTIWSSLFTVGNFLYGRTLYALALGVVFVISGLVLLRVINQLWTNKDA